MEKVTDRLQKLNELIRFFVMLWS